MCSLYLEVRARRVGQSWFPFTAEQGEACPLKLEATVCILSWVTSSVEEVVSFVEDFGSFKQGYSPEAGCVHAGRAWIESENPVLLLGRKAFQPLVWTVVILAFGSDTGGLLLNFLSSRRRENAVEDLDRLCRVDTLESREFFDRWLDSLKPVLKPLRYECRFESTGSENENQSVGAMRLKVEEDSDEVGCAVRSSVTREVHAFLRSKKGLRDSASAVNVNRKAHREFRSS